MGSGLRLVGNLGRGAAVLALAVVPYLGTLGHGFVHDDHMVVLDNPVVLHERYAELLGAPYHAGAKTPTGLYRPLTTLSLIQNHALGGLEPRGYHALNLVLHALASLALFGCALVLGIEAGAAWVGALLFAVHPVHVEGVAYVSGRADVLSALFFLLALSAYVRGRRSGNAWCFFPLAGACYFLALCAKESALPLPAVVLAWEALPGRRRGPPQAGRAGAGLALASLAAPLVPYLLLRQHALSGLLVPAQAVTFVENPVLGQGLVVRLATALAVAGRALGLLLVPWRLSPDYSFAEIVPVTTPLEPFFLLGCAALALAAAFLVRAGRSRPLASFLVLFALLTYAIVSNTFLVIGTIFAERLLYLPSTAFCLLLGVGFAAWRSRSSRLLPTTAALLVLLACTARTLAWSSVWRDDFTLFSAAAKSAPRSVKVLGNLGAGLALRGQREAAREAFTKALVLAPSSLPNRFNLGRVLLSLGDLPGAERELRSVLAADPEDAHAWAQLGIVLQRREDLPGAEAAFRRSLSLDPGVEDARLGLAWIEVQRDDLDAAEQDLLSVVDADPRSATGLHGLGVVELRRGNFERALSWLERAARSSAPDARLLTNLGRALEGMGRAEQARALYRRALELDPDEPGATEALARLVKGGAPATP